MRNTFIFLQLMRTPFALCSLMVGTDVLHRFSRGTGWLMRPSNTRCLVLLSVLVVEGGMSHGPLPNIR